MTTGYRPRRTSRNDFQLGIGVPSAVCPATQEPKPVGIVCCRNPSASWGSFASHAARCRGAIELAQRAYCSSKVRATEGDIQGIAQSV